MEIWHKVCAKQTPQKVPLVHELQKQCHLNEAEEGSFGSLSHGSPTKETRTSLVSQCKQAAKSPSKLMALLQHPIANQQTNKK